MKQIPFAKFRPSISKVLSRVARTGKPVAITRGGVVLVEVHPVEKRAPAKSKRWLGVMKGTGKIVGDIVSPTSDSI